MNLLELVYERFHFESGKRIRMFEAFSGIGCQAMALKRITDNYELVGFSEIDKFAIQSYRAIHGDVPNYGDITKMVSIPSCDIFTYSFPCTDLSKAGKMSGMASDTRSGLVFEVLRLLHNTSDKPKVLIMENVPDLVQSKFVAQFNEIQLELEQMGYRNYNDILNAKDYEIPQNRNRVFMVSILGDYFYEFPSKIKLEKRLKDLLEEKVDEKYYLSDKMTAHLFTTNDKFNVNGNSQVLNRQIGCTITTREGNTRADTSNYMIDNYDEENINIKVVGQLDGFESSDKDTVGVIQAQCYKPGHRHDVVEQNLLIKEDTKKGYCEAYDGDGVYINRPEQKRGVVQSGMIQTIKANSSDIGVVVETLANKLCDNLIEKGLVKGGEIITHSYSNNRMNNMSQIVESDNGIMPTLTTRPDTLGYVEPRLRIRKLTPKECWRLMGIDDSDFLLAKNSGISNSQLYKQAGNGIVVNVFAAILKNLL